MDNTDVVLECFKAFANIGFRCLANKNLLAKSDVIELILTSIETHKADVRVVNEVP